MKRILGLIDVPWRVLVLCKLAINLRSRDGFSNGFPTDNFRPHLFAREAFEPKAHKPPHPEYIEGETILGKTRYGIPVTPSKFVSRRPHLTFLQGVMKFMFAREVQLRVPLDESTMVIAPASLSHFSNSVG